MYIWKPIPMDPEVLEELEGLGEYFIAGHMRCECFFVEDVV